jgi:peptidyl-prolyl cis-trans isomerase D
MIQNFRRIMFSKIGGTITVLFVLLIAGAFALGDVTGLLGGGRVSAGDAVATVGDTRIPASEYEAAIRNGLENERQRDPRMSLQAFIAGGGADAVLDTMIDRAALAEFANRHGIVVSDKLIDSEIVKLPAAQGPDGKFSQTLYQQFLAQQGLTDQMIRKDIAASLIARKVIVPARYGATFSREATHRYAELLRESRKGTIALLPSLSFAPKEPPNDAQLQAHYAKTRDNYILPERRTIRYAVFDAAAVPQVPAPTEAEIAARYKANQARYAASETRRLSQLIVPTEPAARAIAAEVAKGVPLDRAAGAKGLSTTELNVTREQLTSQASAAVAASAFSARPGALAGPARSALGWHLVRVNAVDAKPARTLDQVRGELVTELSELKRRQALVEFSAGIEEKFDEGISLGDVAKELGLELSTTVPLTADGNVFANPEQTAPADLARVISTAFAMEQENQPQLAEIEAGQKFLVFDVNRISPSAPAPLAEVKPAVATDWALAQGVAEAKEAAERVQAAAKKGGDIAQAMAAVGVPLPPVDRVDMNRQELAGQREVPPPLALFFSMAQGTTKLLPAPRNRGWYVVSVSEIVPGKIAQDDPMLADARDELGDLAGQEYAEELLRAIREEVGITRNAAAIAGVKKQLSGDN